ncbi:MAG: SGNH/GDSL hydrolase family protein [Myxococcota bacterium]
MRSLVGLVLASCLVACGPAPLSVEAGPSFGHFEVMAKDAALAVLEEPLSVTVGGVAAYAVKRLGPDSVGFTVQGHPTPGTHEVVVRGRGGEVTVGSLRIEAPPHRAFARLVAFGASLTMGTQDATIHARTQLHGPAALVAKQAGAYLGLPLLKPGYLPTLTPDDFDLTTCTEKEDIFSMLARRATDLIPKLKDRDGNIVLSRLRVDPALEVTNLAIGGSRVTEVVNHPPSLPAILLEHVVWDLDVDAVGLVEPPAESQLDRVVALRPTLVLSTDLIGNDYNNVNLNVDGVPSLDAVTSDEDFTAALRTVLERLDETGAHVFLATGPDATLLPRYDAKVAELKAKGYSDAEATGWRDGLRARITHFNEILLAETARYPRVHVVDVAGKVQDVFAHGLPVGGKTLSPAPFSGLLSIDTMHFSDTGYAVLANAFLEEINRALGADLPLVDVEAVHSADPYTVEALRASGFPCAGTREQ